MNEITNNLETTVDNSNQITIAGSSLMYGPTQGLLVQPEITDDFVERLWEKLYAKKPIIYCAYCNSGNAFDNPTCVQCGGPMGVR